MTPKQRYIFDLSGYLHLKNVLADDELREAQAAIDRLLATPPDPLPSGIQRGEKGFSNGFSFAKSLEALTWHPSTQPIIRELTDGKPRYQPQYEGRASLPQEIIERLSPETQELVASASYEHTKEIVNQDVITLTT